MTEFNSTGGTGNRVFINRGQNKDETNINRTNTDKQLLIGLFSLIFNFSGLYLLLFQC